MREYEVTVKVGPNVIDHPNGKQGLAWDSIKSYLCKSLDAARNRRDAEQRKNRNAIITIRDTETWMQAG